MNDDTPKPIGQHRPLTDYDRGWAEASAQAADRIRELEVALLEVAKERDRLRAAGRQMRLALEGYVSAQSAIDMWDVPQTDTDKGDDSDG